jgi:hypothetical protein
MSTVYTLLQCMPAATTAGLQFHKYLHTRDGHCGVADSPSHAQAENASSANHATSIIYRDVRVVYRSGRVSGRD